jgi:hypothetical protein
VEPENPDCGTLIEPNARLAAPGVERGGPSRQPLVNRTARTYLATFFWQRPLGERTRFVSMSQDRRPARFGQLLVSTGLVAVLVSCGSEGGSGSDATDTELRDATEVNREQAEENSTRVEYGVAAEHEGVSVVVNAPQWGEGFTSGETEYRDVTMDVVFENRSDADIDSPLVTVHCESDEGFYSNQHSGPIDPFDPLPSGTKAEGQTETSATVPCQDGWIQWTPSYDLDAPTFRWDLPPSP